MYISIDLKNHKASAFIDIKQAANSINISYSTLRRHLDKKGYYEKDHLRVFIGDFYKSSRGNPNFGRL